MKRSDEETSSREIRLILNWTEELKRRVPRQRVFERGPARIEGDHDSALSHHTSDRRPQPGR